VLAAGALDAWAVPVQMKKGRPAVTLAALAPADRLDRVEETLFAETSTFGVRSWPVHRRVLDRETRAVETELGRVTVKIGSLDGEVLSIAPEFESCRRLADRAGVPLRTVYDAARRGLEATTTGGHPRRPARATRAPSGDGRERPGAKSPAVRSASASTSASKRTKTAGAKKKKTKTKTKATKKTRRSSSRDRNRGV